MKILNIIITITCLGGLVSCYPIATNNPNTHNKTASAQTSTKINTGKKKPTVQSSTSASVTGQEKPFNDHKDEPTASDPTPSSEENKVEENKPVVPAAIKTASKVPGKDGFVFNPYTHNQVDVRGIPSGTKVRDPHDSNPAHIFRVP